ncbi:uncharacterized protein LOC121403940 isoform X2 [Drosophila obscura]|uniref:uncharacterized protein LOC121403940 isoform X2 n=1 Tax=Drosophila obscura TaxID=7282 RepID=UPI001BB162D1|nr:uncharacterized protein LOC121403940 isoform X2 [Drosophila obscura]
MWSCGQPENQPTRPDQTTPSQDRTGQDSSTDSCHAKTKNVGVALDIANAIAIASPSGQCSGSCSSPDTRDVKRNKKNILLNSRTGNGSSNSISISQRVDNGQSSVVRCPARALRPNGKRKFKRAKDM